eukprot:2017630-Karenia_brevis.AAC.1
MLSLPVSSHSAAVGKWLPCVRVPPSRHMNSKGVQKSLGLEAALTVLASLRTGRHPRCVQTSAAGSKSISVEEKTILRVLQILAIKAKPGVALVGPTRSD